MIKFWKSAAKGKSGCPVRPPETSTTPSIETRQLDTEIDIDDNLNIFEKKSKLSITLYDILIDKTAINYFVMYMESINKQYLIKCWLELESFKLQSQQMNNDNDKSYPKISQTKSLDNHANDLLKDELDKSCDKFMSQKFTWKTSATSLKMTKGECSTSSCGDLIEHLDNYELFEDKNVDITERAITLFKKFVALEAPYQLDLTDNVRKIVISNICQPEGLVREDCFKPVLDSLYHQIEKNFFSEFQNSPFYAKSQIDILTSGCINLKDILYNETILFYFTEYLEQESCSNLLEFLIAVMHFRDNVLNNQSNSESAQSDAIVLYDKYFSLQATNPIGFSSDIRLKVESDICSEVGVCGTCFDIPYKIVYNTLNKYVKTFLGSELYYTYLSEMIKSVDRLWSPNCKSHSDCSSEFSISSKNTLLAMGDSNFRKKRNHSVPDMSIDSNQLYNADALWQRKKHDGLSLGRINSLGRFESKFEPDPDKKDKSVLKKMVSKFVATNPSKVEEEMAWQIAHMIVKDITDLTMAPPENYNGHI